MPFNINQYKQNVAQYGVLRNNHFKVMVTVPQILQGTGIVTGGGVTSTGGIANMLSFRAEQFKAPGITLDTKNAYRYGMGPYQKMPFSGRYTDNSITFLSDSYGLMWNFWYQWIDSIFNFAGNDNAPGSSIGGINTLPSYQIEYKERYATQMSVIMYNNEGQETMKVNMYDAYPISLNDVQLNWGAKNEVVKVTVGITFKEFTIERSTVAGNYQPSQSQAVPNVRKGYDNPSRTSQFLQQQGAAAGSPNPPIRNP